MNCRKEWNWHKLYLENAEVEVMYQHFINTYYETVKTNIPTKILKKKVSHPWISLEIKKLMRKRNKKYRSMKKKGSDKLKEEVRLLKKEIRNLARARPHCTVHTALSSSTRPPSTGKQEFEGLRDSKLAIGIFDTTFSIISGKVTLELLFLLR